MSDRAGKTAGPAQRGGGGAGIGARGSARHGAVAEEAARVAKARRNAWLLAGLAVLFYVGYIAWMSVRASSGG